jgi:hypothetical protein
MHGVGVAAVGQQRLELISTIRSSTSGKFTYWVFKYVFREPMIETLFGAMSGADQRR